MSFSFRQGINPHEGKILVGGWGGGDGGDQWVFLFAKEKILTRKKSLWEGGGDILFKFQLGFLLCQRGNPHIPSLSPTHKEINPVRIFSLTKRKTRGNFLGQPWVFLFIKEEILTRKKSSWECGGGRVGGQWGFLFVKEENLTRKKSSWERGGDGGHQGEYLKMIFYWSYHEGFFSSSKRKSSRRVSPGGGGGWSGQEEWN